MKDIYNDNKNNKQEIIDFLKINYSRELCSHELYKIDDWQKHNDNEKIIKAISISIENNVKKFSYVSAILNNWNKEDSNKITVSKVLSKEDIELLNYDWLNDPENWFNWDK
jgi:DnaD/phage-associated family protein